MQALRQKRSTKTLDRSGSKRLTTRFSISDAVQEQESATQAVSSNVAAVTRAAGETGGSSNDVLNAARLMSGQATDLQEKVDSFLLNVRAM